MTKSASVRFGLGGRADEAICEQTRENVARYASATPALIERRLAELDAEWDVERVAALVRSLALTTGVVLTATLGLVWLVLPALVAGCQLSHALVGWWPSRPLCRRLGFRTAREIACERYAIKAIRGDFHAMAAVTTPQDREDLARFEDEGGAVGPEPEPAGDPKVVDEAIRAAQS